MDRLRRVQWLEYLAAAMVLAAACTETPTNPPAAASQGAAQSRAPTPSPEAPNAAPMAGFTVVAKPTLPTLESALSPLATARPTGTPPGWWEVANTDGDGVFVRARAGTDDRVKAYPEGTVLEALGSNLQGEGHGWLHVRAPDGVTGWIPDRYAKPASAPSATPTARPSPSPPTATAVPSPTRPPPPTASPTRASAPVPAGFFTAGSPREVVLAMQGTPNSLRPTELAYGFSTVYLDDGKLVGWSNSGNLKVQLVPAVAATRPYFTPGSTADEVVSVQGTPNSFRIGSTEWGYGFSSVYLSDGRVTGWSNSGNLKAQLVPAAASSRDIFTARSTEDEVASVQGTPSSYRVGTTEWGYGFSSVYFRDGKVTGCSNSGNLKARLIPAAAATAGYFTAGSSKDEVIATQGTPASFRVGATGWSYGFSSVHFQEDRVSGWSNAGNLKVRLLPKVASTATRFTVGSTTDEVLSVQGTPSSFRNGATEWSYGFSSVAFRNGRVVGWSSSGNLKVAS